MISPNRFFQCLFLIGALSCLYFGTRFGLGWHAYSRLQGAALGRATQWEIVSSGDRFAVQADYIFEAQGKTWRGTSRLKNKFYLNEFSAFSDLKNASKKELTVYYDLRNPGESALEKAFPAGWLVRAVLAGAATIYFFVLLTKIRAKSS